MARNAVCRCPWCHAHLVADLRRAAEYDDDVALAYLATDDDLHKPPTVKLDNQLEALVSQGCSCAYLHNPALTPAPPRPKYLPPKPFDPTEDNE